MSRVPPRPADGQAVRSSGEPPDPGLAHQVSQVARSLQAEPGADRLLQAIVRAAADNVPGADYAGITLVSSRGAVTTPAGTDEVVDRIDALQAETGQGPCLSSAREHKTVRSDDLSVEPRWPEFASRAVEIGVRSMLCFQLFVKDDSVGALNLYSVEPDVFGDESEDIGLLLAAHSAVALAAAMKEGNLRVALTSRDMIGQAKGILMERHKVGSDAAFQLLIRASQTSNRKLSAVAEMVTSTGQDPTTEAIDRF